MTPSYPSDHEDPPEEGTWEHPSSSSFEGIPPRDASTWVRRTRGWFFQTWHPKPLALPRADSEMIQFGPVERMAEVFRYMFHRLEYWISPSGWLREWIRLNVRLAILMAIPALLVGPLVTQALIHFNAWVQQLNNSISAMVLAPLSDALVLGLICLVLYLVRMLPFRRHPSNPYHQDRYY